MIGWPRRLRSANPVTSKRRCCVVKKVLKAKPSAPAGRLRTAGAGDAVGSCPRQSVVLHDVIAVCNCQLFGLVAGEFYGSADVGRYDALVAALVQQRVDGLNSVPALFARNFRQVCRCFAVVFLVVKLDTYSVSADLPVKIVMDLLEASQYRDRTVETRKLVLGDWTEPTVLNSTRNCVFSKAAVKVDCAKCSYASSKSPIPANFPCHEQRVCVVFEGRIFRRIRRMQVAVEYIEAEIAHFWSNDGNCAIDTIGWVYNSCQAAVTTN